MPERYPHAGIYENIYDFSTYAINLAGNRAFLLFSALQGEYATPKYIGSGNEFRSVFGDPIKDDTYGAYMIANMIPIIGARVGWVYPGITTDGLDDTIEDYLEAQISDSDTAPWSTALKRRTGAFEVSSMNLSVVTTDISDIKSDGIEIWDGVGGVFKADIAFSAGGTYFDPADEVLGYDPENAVWTLVWTRIVNGISREYTITGVYNKTTSRVEFYNPLSNGKISIDPTGDGTITENGTYWSATIGATDSLKLFASKVGFDGTHDPVILRKVFLKGYLYNGNDSASFMGNPGAFGADMSIYIEPVTFTDDNYLESVNVYILKGGVIVETIENGDITTTYESDTNNLERLIDNTSKYIRLVKDGVDGHCDFTNLKALAYTDFYPTTAPTTYTYFNGILFDIDDDITTGHLHNSVVIPDPKVYSYYDMIDKDGDIWEGTNTRFRNEYGANDIFTFDKELTEVLANGSGTTSVTTAVMKLAMISTITNYVAPFMESEKYDYNLAYSFISDDASTSIIKNMFLSLSESRNDFYFTVDSMASGVAPITSEDAVDIQDAFGSDWRFTQYGPRTRYYNTFSLKSIWLGTGFAGLYAMIENDKLGNVWNAPAGLNRAKLPLATGVEVDWSKSDLDTLYGYPNRVNPVVEIPGEGIVVMGQKTAQKKPSALDRINVARTLLYLMKTTRVASRYLVFENTTTDLFKEFKRLVTPIYDEVLTKNGLYAYQIVMDSSNNTSTTIDRNELHGAIMLQIVKTAEKIILDYILTPTGADFNIYLQ